MEELQAMLQHFDFYAIESHDHREKDHYSGLWDQILGMLVRLPPHLQDEVMSSFKQSIHRRVWIQYEGGLDWAKENSIVK